MYFSGELNVDWLAMLILVTQLQYRRPVGTVYFIKSLIIHPYGAFTTIHDKSLMQVTLTVLVVYLFTVKLSTYRNF